MGQAGRHGMSRPDAPAQLPAEVDADLTIGLIGAGNMGAALARGLGRPVLATDNGSGRAQLLVDELGGERVASNAELAKRADLVILGHKPYQLDAVAAEVAPHASRVLSLLGGVDLAGLRAAYPQAVVTLALPNTPVAHRAGVIILATDDGPRDEAIRPLLQVAGTVVEVPERLAGVAASVSSVGPAYFALVTETWIDAAVRSGLTPQQATTLLVETMAGTATLLRENGGDTLAARRAVTSPGGSTARGLAALEREGLRRAFSAATDDVIDG